MTKIKLVVVLIMGTGSLLCQAHHSTAGPICKPESDVQILADGQHEEPAGRVRDLLREAGCPNAVVNSASTNTERIDKVKFFNDGDAEVVTRILRRTDQLLRQYGIHAAPENMIKWNRDHGNKVAPGHVEFWLTKPEKQH